MKTLSFWLQRIFAVFALLLLAAVMMPLVNRSPENKYRAQCQTNLKQMALAVKQYQQDYPERYPLVSSGKHGWADVLQPYTKNSSFFQCPAVEAHMSVLDRLRSADNSSLTSDYWYNARLAKREEPEVDSVALTVIFGDGLNDAKTNASLSSLPPLWLTIENSPARRHLDGLNFAFADGHVKWFRPEKMTTRPANAGQPTFSLQ